ncbi:MAG: cysteine synthase A [Deltaproteobacteria bacterium]|nr:cysteine synthase A [Deltaproteobacteria bacterium]
MSAERVLDLIGKTPLVEVPNTLSPSIFAKAEFLNPGGSVKDRVAKHLIECAERDGLLNPDTVIVEATSGNTGIGVALVGRLKGYRVVIVMPESMSEERKKIIRALGAELVATPSNKSIKGAVDKARELVERNQNIWLVDQFGNPHNPEVHYLQTGPELYEQMDGKVDAFVAGVGSGGTLQGVGRYLKEKNTGVKLVAVEPEGASALLGEEPGLHRIHQIQGIGDGFIPDVLDTSMIDQVITVSDDDAIYTTRQLARKHGLLVGTSSGANFWAAQKVAEEIGAEARVATIFPDRAERYFSTALI